MESSKSLFAVIRQYGSLYNPQKPLEAQPEWEAHRVFMNALEAEGLARLAGPLEETAEVLLIFRGENKEEIDRRLKADLWDPLDRADSTVGICGSARWRRAALAMSMPSLPRMATLHSFVVNGPIPGRHSAAPLIWACWETCGPMRRSYK